MRRIALMSLVLIAPLAAQREHPFFHGALGFSAGRYGFDSTLSGFDDHVDAGLFLAEFEATTRSGIGGGLRYEFSITEDDRGLFRTSAFDRGTEARNNNLFLHFTQRIESHRFAMPVRVGLMLNSLTLEDTNRVDPDATYASIGPYLEIEPELTLVRRRGFRWSLYGQLGFGIGATSIDVDGDYRDYWSTTGFFGLEAGTRFRFGPAEIGIGYIGRFRSMDDSDIEDGQFVFGYDDDYNGLLVTMGVTF